MEEKTLPFRFETARRTVTEPDVVTFVNTVGLFEPIFIDQEYVKKNMPESHHRRFAPAPLVMSMAMGLVAPHIQGWLDRIIEGRRVGFIGGMTGLVARVFAPVLVGDTIRVTLFAGVSKVSSRGHTLVDLRHLVKNQEDVLCVDFTETILYLPPAEEK
ncbi:MAG: MaoC family dehydratase [Thermodesulfobacteriota bacterium]